MRLLIDDKTVKIISDILWSPDPCGVRIGTAEIYRVVENINDSLVVWQEWHDDERVILFVQLAENIELTNESISKLKSTIKKTCSPRYVPSIILPIGDIP